jgi:integrase/recombinase XerC
MRPYRASMQTDSAHAAEAFQTVDWALAERYLEHVRVHKRLAQRTVELYFEDLKKLSRFAVSQELNLCQLQSTHIRQCVARMHASGRSARGIALILSGWRGFYKWLGQESLVSANPVDDVKTPKAAKPLPKALSADEAAQLMNFGLQTSVSGPSLNAGSEAAHELSKPELDPWTGARLQAMLELLYGCGLRMAELTGLDVHASTQSKGWVDLSDATAHVLGKGSKRRSVPVGAKAMAALRVWLELRKQGLPQSQSPAQTEAECDALFINRRGQRLSPQYIRQLVKSIAQESGLQTPVHPHMLRHSYASHLLQSSGDIRAVQELLGHANISTTQIYTRLDFQHLAKVYDAAHPRAHLSK